MYVNCFLSCQDASRAHCWRDGAKRWVTTCLYHPRLRGCYVCSLSDTDAQDSAQNETDGRQEATQQQPRQGQQGGGGATPGSTDTPPTGGTEGGGGARGTTASTQNARRNNVHVINFPSVQVMMTRGGHPVPVGGQQQQPGTSQGGATGGGGGGGASNPQLPQFGAPMFFGLPL